LTFAIPYYSGPDYLRRAIESVLRQTNPHWHLLICDDGPAGGVAELVHSYPDPRIEYRRNPRHLGMAGNWNSCLDLAPTDLVTLLHADDELLPHYAELMLAAAARYPDAVAFFCQAKIIGNDGGERFSFADFIKRFLAPAGDRPLILRGEDAVRGLLRGNFIMCPTLCYRKSRLRARRFADCWRFVQDLDLFSRLLLDGETLVGLRDVAYAYRRHADNATVQYTASLVRFREEAELYAVLHRRLTERKWWRAARTAERKYIVRLNLGYCALQDLCRLRFAQAGRKVRLLWQL
jgi:glycosyltransferase involved in cell wall biosynthesis